MTGTADVRTDWATDGVFRITLDRPTKRNAITAPMLAVLDVVMEWALTSSGVRAVILAGSGGTFCAGADVSIFATGGAVASDYVRRGRAFVEKMTRARKPVIAAVDGPAMGGGFELALACAARVVSARAIFGLPEVTLGVIPAWGGVTNLKRLCGPAVALDVALNGKRITAVEALRFGLVHQVVGAEEVDNAAVELATRLAGWSSTAVAGILELASPVGADRERELELFDTALSRPEAKIAINSFLKRKAA
jgi:enoyl-CoA hydratase/carnithine racemase